MRRLVSTALMPIAMTAFSILLLIPRAASPQQEYWTRGADMPTGRSEPAAAAVDGQIYVIGGSGGSGSAVEAYNPVTDAWTPRAEMPTPRQGLAAVVLDDKIYAVGGRRADVPRATVEVYDPQTDSWTRKADLLKARSHFAAAVAGGRIYAIGGLGNTSPTSRMEAYDPTTDTWTELGRMSSPENQMPAAVVDGRIYIVGGVSGLVQMRQFDPETGTWALKAQKPTGNHRMAAAVLDGQIYAMGGCAGCGNPAGLEVYDPPSDTWRTLEDMPREAGSPVAAAAGGRIFVFGGGTVWIYEWAYPHLVASGTGELHGLAGSDGDHLIEVVLGGPSEDGTYPELWLDTSVLGQMEGVPLTHQGDGRYRGRLLTTVAVGGLYSLPVRVGSPQPPGKYLYSIELGVWPTASLPILSEDLAPGWQAKPRSLEELILAQSGTVSSGSTACAVQAKSSFAGWTLQLEAEESLHYFGYEILHLAIHPGDLAPSDSDRLTLTLGGGTEPVDLLDGGLIDWSHFEWQSVDIPLAQFGPEGPITGLQFYGTPAGTFYIDELSLLPGEPPELPGTAVAETRIDGAPSACGLHPNYPNPFNSSTTLRFDLPTAANVELAALVRGPRQAGTYVIAWDGTDDRGGSLATGVYLYRLRAGAHTDTRRLLLLR